ncbi:hypothetical protein [Deinococcus sp. Leaf326]|uniref:hypothetical protein n=1 Tax=Deinococcus sp. Leaf326 TaxID=1736338 RepID=UPI0006F85707|nr:hypothetical protein [Deinococcus sp. Leaf326]KQR40738.1 hypothetical protein ASF71_00795 [Deinococcus sp. Leaf326]
MKYQFMGDVLGAENAEVTATLTYLGDYRDPDGALPPPVLLYRRAPGSGWAGQPGGGPAWVWGPELPGQPVPKVRVTYVVLQAGLPPLARTVERRVLPNTDQPGYWDFTRPDTEQPSWSGGNGTPTPVEVQPGQGPQGERGAGWLHGRGAPTAGLGGAGDLYLDTGTWDVWTRGVGGWVIQGNLKGGAGGPGPRGLNGRGVPAHTTAQNGHALVADGSPEGAGWKGLTLAALTDVDVTGLQDGQVLVWDKVAGLWRPGAGGGGGQTDYPVLENGISQEAVLSASNTYLQTFQFDVPVGMTSLVVMSDSPSGEPALSLDFNLPPDDNRPAMYNVPANTAITVASPDAGRWYVSLGATTAFSANVTAYWSSDSGSEYSVITDAEGYQTITDATATTDAEGYQMVQGAWITEDEDGFHTLKRS